MTGTCDTFKMFSFSVMQSTFRFSNEMRLYKFVLTISPVLYFRSLRAAKAIFVWKGRLNPASIIKNNPKIDKTINFTNTSYNIASRAAQSNSVYVSMLKTSIVHADCASKSLCLKFFFRVARAAIVSVGKILYFATIMDRNRDSVHQSQNEDNFRPFLLG